MIVNVNGQYRELQYGNGNELEDIKMDKKSLTKLKKAVKNMETENDTFFIEGDLFSCRWNGNSFDWIINNHLYNCTAKEVLSFIGNGDFITNYCYDYDNY